MKYIDLSYDIENKMRVHPYDSDVEVYQDKFLHTDKYNNFRLNIGTHIDSPMHMTDDKTFIGDYDIDRFCGNAKVFDVRGISLISVKDIDINVIKNEDIVLFYTGYEDSYGFDEYYSGHPVLDYNLAEVLVEKKIKLVGVDMPSPDRYPFEVHKLLFSKGVFIVENLKNLGLLLGYQKLEVYMFPLKVKADASFIRAVAKVDF